MSPINSFNDPHSDLVNILIRKGEIMKDSNAVPFDIIEVMSNLKDFADQNADTLRDLPIVTRK